MSRLRWHAKERGEEVAVKPTETQAQTRKRHLYYTQYAASLDYAADTVDNVSRDDHEAYQGLPTVRPPRYQSRVEMNVEYHHLQSPRTRREASSANRPYREHTAADRYVKSAHPPTLLQKTQNRHRRRLLPGRYSYTEPGNPHDFGLASLNRKNNYRNRSRKFAIPEKMNMHGNVDIDRQQQTRHTGFMSGSSSICVMSPADTR